MDSKDFTVLYDFLEVRGGAESVFLSLMSRHESITGVVAYINPRSFELPKELSCRISEISVRSEIQGLKSVLGMWAFSRLDPALLSDELVIYSGSNSLLAVNRSSSKKNIYYCHTPPRFAYDLHAYWMGQVKFWQRPFLKILTLLTKTFYESSIKNMDLVIANSANVQDRLKNFLGVDSVVVHPPCDVENCRWLSDDGYYLSTARLEEYKRVDKIIEAFKLMPTKKLVVASGGSQFEMLKSLAQGAKNISFTNWVEKSELTDLIGRATATIYVPIDEDFGISPVDSMAAGKPVIGVADGGLLETIVDGKTGYLLDPGFSGAEMIAAIEKLDSGAAAEMRLACETQAKRFSSHAFFENLGKYVP